MEMGSGAEDLELEGELKTCAGDGRGVGEDEDR